jgi:hypothetical protein
MTTTTTAPIRPRQEPRATDLITEVFSGTPGKLRIFGAVAVIACLSFGGFGFWIVQNLNGALRDERAHAAQLVRVQAIQTNIFKADASATNAFLVGGGEPPATRQTYVSSIADAAEILAEAANADGNRGEALRTVNEVLVNYTGLIESARANNRQNFPIGAAYLRQASKTIRDNALPELDKLVQSERDRVASSSDDVKQAQTQLLALLALVVIALLVTQFYLYQKTRRVLNKPLVLATFMVVASGLFATALIGWARDREDKARQGPYAQTVALATARIAGFDGKSAESLYLISRGSGPEWEERFQQVAADGNEALVQADDGATRDAFESYIAQHQQVQDRESNGRHDEAIKLATGSGAANKAFAAFDSLSADNLQAEADDLGNDLNDARQPLLALALLLLVVGLISALVSRRGIAQRLQEYR